MLVRYANYLSGTPLSNYLDILNSVPVSLNPILEHIKSRPHDPLLIHCTAGKDRTGVISAILLSAAGVEDRVVADEYALTQLSMGKMLDALGDRVRELPVFKKLEHQGIPVSEEGVRNLLGSKPETVTGLLEKIKEDGGLAHWLREKCEMDDKDLEHLKEALTLDDLIQD